MSQLRRLVYRLFILPRGVIPPPLILRQDRSYSGAVLCVSSLSMLSRCLWLERSDFFTPEQEGKQLFCHRRKCRMGLVGRFFPNLFPPFEEKTLSLCLDHLLLWSTRMHCENRQTNPSSKKPNWNAILSVILSGEKSHINWLDASSTLPIVLSGGGAWGDVFFAFLLLRSRVS